MILNLPNILTLMRIVLIPVLVLAFYYPVDWANIAATGIFFIAGVTDWLDGYLARKMGVSSRFGQSNSLCRLLDRHSCGHNRRA